MTTPQNLDVNNRFEQRASRDLPSLLSQICASDTRNRARFHDRGTVLFAEGEPVRGVYILQTGRAAVCVSSSEGRVVILRMAHAGEVLGLNCVLSNSFYDTTVKALVPCCVYFMSCNELMEFIEQSQAGANAVLLLLGRELTQLTERTRSLLLPQTACARLARLLLECGEVSPRIEKVFTQEEIAQMIGSSRETVTRLFTMLRKRNIIQITSDSVVICARQGLEDMLESRNSDLNSCGVLTDRKV